MGDISAISLWQPYATLIVTGDKRYETRHWRAPHRVIGQRVAIHAAKRRPKNEEIDYLDILVAMMLGEGWHRSVPFGAIVGTAIIAACHQVAFRNGDEVALHNGGSIEDDYLGDYSVGRWIWQLADPIQFEEPIPATGLQGFWRWKP